MDEDMEVVATVMLKSIGDMTKSKREGVCSWLRKIADEVEIFPQAYARVVRFKYHTRRTSKCKR